MLLGKDRLPSPALLCPGGDSVLSSDTDETSPTTAMRQQGEEWHLHLELLSLCLVSQSHSLIYMPSEGYLRNCLVVKLSITSKESPLNPS